MNSIATPQNHGGFLKRRSQALFAAIGAADMAQAAKAKEAQRGSSLHEDADILALDDEAPLVVDLDGTLIKTDLLLESFLALLSSRPLEALRAVAALRHGKAALKSRLARQAAVALDALPLDEALIAQLRRARQRGRKIYLASASDRHYVEPLAKLTRLFDGVFSSDGKANLSRENKAAALCDAFGEGRFDYIGNSRADLPVWHRARHVVVSGASPLFAQRVRRRFPDALQVARRRFVLGDYIRALRVHQWLKNFLILVPALAAHQFAPHTIVPLLLAFMSFSLFASSTYLINDLLDLNNDRKHRSKRHRPFASGAIPLAHGPAMVLCLMASSFALANDLPPRFLALLGAYGVSTLAYSLWLKRKMMVDTLVLACLYGMRLVAGGLAAAVPLSPWLVAFSTFFFLSLAIVKRCTELIAHGEAAKGSLSGRGYQLGDLPILEGMAAASGYVAGMVFALYINSPAVEALYRAPERLWLICVVLIYWVSRMILLTHRGRMHDDPIVFAATDRTSLIAAAVVAAIVMAAI